jgi:hypothetical protein
MLSGENEALQKSARRAAIFPENSTLPNRHPSESWDPVPLTLLSRWMIRFAHPSGAILRMFSALRATSSFCWDDERFSH